MPNTHRQELNHLEREAREDFELYASSLFIDVEIDPSAPAAAPTIPATTLAAHYGLFDEQDRLMFASADLRDCDHSKMTSGNFEGLEWLECSECGFNWYAPVDGDLQNALKVWSEISRKE